MSALPLGRYRQLLHQLLQLNEQAAALKKELNSFVDTGLVAGQESAGAEGAASSQEIADVSSPEEMTAAGSEACLNDADDKDEVAGSSESRSERPARKPHFLDDDYPLKAGMCTAPKLHFLDNSPSPDEEDVNVPSAFVPALHKKVPEECVDTQARHSSLLPGQAGISSNVCQMYDCSWQVVEREMWQNQDSCSVKSFSSVGSGNTSQMGNLPQQLEQKVDSVYQLLSLLSLSADCNADMSEYLLEISNNIDSCITMRQSGCIPLLVQLIHSKHSRMSRHKAARALHNLIHAQPDNKAGRREVRVLRLLEIVREYCQILEDLLNAKRENVPFEDDMSQHPVQSVATLMKLSFDEEHRHVMCQLGGLQSLASLVIIDQAAHGSLIEDTQCVTMRKYSGMALTNLTFGDGNNKALLCSFKDFMMALVDQLQSPNEDMRQVTAAVLRNLSWRADSASKQILREVGAVKGLTLAAMSGHKEATLKSVLSALWNLTAHCSLNKIDICSVEGALAFLVKMLSFDAPSKTLAIIENAGGILRNVSSHIAVREDYRQILRDHNCLKVLLQQLKSPSLTIVSNSCGTLWNLSARCQQDQQYLWDNGAVPMLRSLIHSKHKMIAMGSSAALKNLLNSKPGKNHPKALDGTCRDLNLPLLPTLGARKQRALEQEIDQNLSETCENIEPTTSPTTNNRDEKLILSAAEKHLAFSIEKRRMSSSSPLIGPLASQLSLSHKGYLSKGIRPGNVNRSESKDSVSSAHSDSVYERVSRDGRFSNFSDFQSKSKGNSINNINAKVDSPRSNYSDTGYMEQFCCDQPIDYSQKYSEAKTLLDQNIDIPKKDSFSKKVTTRPVFGDYQETDLDQPTDYSLRYAEDAISTISDSQEMPMPEDTIKHFCTEGTPYETPINFSTATSMSDLRAIPGGIEKPTKKKTPNETASDVTPKENATVMSQSNEKDTCSIEENTKVIISNEEKPPKSQIIPSTNTNIVYTSKFSSGIQTPEKPTNYCEEGTPGYFSRVSSLSSLEEIGDPEISKCKKDEQEFSSKASDTESKTEKATDSILLGAPTMLNYAEETPLMFSRCSSLGSISECSVPEQADDVGSVVSEFSRLTSGCISPSELPDSPTQSPVPRNDPSNHPIPASRIAKVIKTPQPKDRLRSVFEDEVSTFQCEDTPIEFSTGTSLSSLTIDDEPKIKFPAFDLINRSDGVGCSSPTEIPKNRNNLSIDEIDSKKNISESLNDSELESENILAMCIDVGVQSSIKPRNTNKNNSLISTSPMPSENRIGSSVLNDMCHTYCTEDTPAILSKVGSQSNLSELSFLEAENDIPTSAKCIIDRNASVNKKDYSDDSSNISGDSDNLLAECIRSGMPKKAKNIHAVPGDELKNYLVEGTPFQHSACSSLSDLTIESKDTRILDKRLDIPNEQFNTGRNLKKESLSGSVSSVELGSDDGQLLDMAIRAGVPQQNGETPKKIDPKSKKNIPKTILDIASMSLNDKKEKSQSKIKRNDSLSSLSDDSIEPNDGDQALFEECIKSGMSRGNSNNWENSQTLDKNFKSRFSGQNKQNSFKHSSRKNRSLERTENDRDPEFESLVNVGAFGTCSKKFSKTEENISGKCKDEMAAEDYSCSFKQNIIMTLSANKNYKEAENTKMNYSKNVQVTSVAANTPNLHLSTAASDVKNPMITEKTKVEEERAIPIAKALVTGEETDQSSKIPLSNGVALKNFQSQSITQNGSNDTTDSIISMIEKPKSDRSVTIRHVNQTDSEILMKESFTEKDSSGENQCKRSTDTWNDNTCPTDVEFPTISGSVPMIASFKSDIADEITCNGALPDLLEESVVHESTNYPDLTNKLNENTELSEQQLNSTMNDNHDSETRFSSLSSSTMIENEAARLALLVSKTYDYSSFSPSCNPSLDLDNIKPPSQMGSLVSLTQSISGNWDEGENSEYDRNLKTNPCNRRKSLPTGIMARKALGLPLANHGSCTSADNSFVSNLDNIKPPADMNDTYDMENSMLSVASIVSEVADSERLGGFHFDLEFPINPPQLLTNFECNSIIIDNVNPPSLFDELSESTLDPNSEYGSFPFPLHDSISEQVTFKSADPVIKQKDFGMKKYLTAKQKRQLSKERYKTYTISPDQLTNSDEAAASSVEMKDSLNEQTFTRPEKGTLSPKQKRQEDRMRYQTQTVNISDLNSIFKMNNQSSIVSKLRKSPKQKRTENIERYQTRILESHHPSSNSSGSQENLLESDSSTVTLENSSDDYHAQLVKDATIAFDLLQKQTVEDSSFIDLDCETMSLISEDDAELNSLRMRTFTKSFRNYLPVIESPTAVDKCIVKNLKNMNLNLEPKACEQQSEIEKLNSFECDQNSGTESADQNQYSDSEIDNPPPVAIKPKITKPYNGLKGRNSGSAGSLNSDDAVGKTVRGGRKKAYVSPYKRSDTNVKKGSYKMSSTTKYSKANTTFPKASNGLSIKSQPMLRKPVNLVTKTSSPLKMNEKTQKTGKISDSIKNKFVQKPEQAKCENKPQPLVRQGTFVKEESTVKCASTVEQDVGSCAQNMNNSKLAKPGTIAKTISSSSKVPLHQNKSPPSKLGNVKAKNTSTNGQSCAIPNTKWSQTRMKSSSSNQSLQSNDSTKTVTLSNKGKSDGKSTNSSVSSESVNATKLSTKNITSKVSSLWKRVEESKKLQAKPDTRVWIKCESGDVPAAPNPSSMKLIRSSTFEGPSKTSVNTAPKQKSSINLKVSQLPVCKYTSKVPIKSASKPGGL